MGKAWVQRAKQMARLGGEMEGAGPTCPRRLGVSDFARRASPRGIAGRIVAESRAWNFGAGRWSWPRAQAALPPAPPRPVGVPPQSRLWTGGRLEADAEHGRAGQPGGGEGWRTGTRRPTRRSGRDGAGDSRPADRPQGRREMRKKYSGTSGSWTVAAGRRGRTAARAAARNSAISAADAANRRRLPPNTPPSRPRLRPRPRRSPPPALPKVRRPSTLTNDAGGSED